MKYLCILIIFLIASCVFTPEYELIINNPYDNVLGVHYDSNSIQGNNISDQLIIRIDYNINGHERTIFKTIAPLELVDLYYLHGEDCQIDITNVGLY